ncbi:GmrSD restriction endonuclease domain-containing protein [Streptomyces angustmyceticus]|uniref:GmrSD restriction endonuclease domain-containing protein n=1 Tax=Streptomyces angustmyceticus TaxID=285578 RepID=UPI0037FDB625
MAELDSQPRSIQSIYAWYSENKLWVNRRYQRKLVWTQEEKQKLIESVLKRYPIPAILIAEREGGDYEVIDGLQRLHTMVSFIETAFPTIDNRYFDVTQFVTAKIRATEEKAFTISSGKSLTAREVGTFLDYSVAVTVMRGASDEEIDDVFARINTYGHRLSDQERRQSGVRDEFSTLVRELACDVRGDASSDILTLAKMPSISIDLPKTKHGYEVAADDVFWVQQGVLRSTDLRDSMDEQCIADIAASTIGEDLVERSKDALDKIYQTGSAENLRIVRSLDSYGKERFAAEFKLCLDEIGTVCEGNRKLRSIIFSKKNTNPFPSVFAVLFMAFHELLIGENKKIADYPGIKSAITDLDKRIETSRASTAPAERRRNVDTIKGLIRAHFVDSEPRDIYGDHTTTDIKVTIMRSEIEAPHYELKQGMLRLDGNRKVDVNLQEKILCTICAIANNGPGRSGTILIGVADKPADVERILFLDGIKARPVGRRFVVGVRREAEALGETTEKYFARWKELIRSSDMTRSLRDDVLASLSYSEYHGLGVIVIKIPGQRDVSLLNDKLYIRSGDETVEVKEMSRMFEIGKRFNRG